MNAWLAALILISTFMDIGCSCHDTTVEPPKPITTKLTLDDVAVTEAWITVTTTEGKGAFTLKRDSGIVVAHLSAPVDTIIHDMGLLPKHTYTYITDTSSHLTVTTMDTTSHNFTWDIDTLGAENAPNTLNDVAIVNDTLAYAVGEIYMLDSSGNLDIHNYNLARWNGKTWSMFRVPTAAYPNYIDSTPINTIFAFNENDIWTFSAAGSYSHWNGSVWETKYISARSGGGNKLWGTSSNNLYLVGTNGSITYFDGASWFKIASGTTLDFYDIWGAYNDKTSKYEILAVASNHGSGRERKIVQLSGYDAATSISYAPIVQSLVSIWFIPNKHYYVIGSGIYEKHSLLDSIWTTSGLDVTHYFTSSIRGNALNDIMIVGSFGECLHYNGMSMKSYMNTGTGIDGEYGCVRMKGNLVIAVGDMSSGYYLKAIALIGRR